MICSTFVVALSSAIYCRPADLKPCFLVTSTMFTDDGSLEDLKMARAQEENARLKQDLDKIWSLAGKSPQLKNASHSYFLPRC